MIMTSGLINTSINQNNVSIYSHEYLFIYYINVYLMSKNNTFIMLTHLKRANIVYVNLFIWLFALQSSVFECGDKAFKAVDGNTDQDHFYHSKKIEELFT